MSPRVERFIQLQQQIVEFSAKRSQASDAALVATYDDLLHICRHEYAELKRLSAEASRAEQVR